MLKSLPKNASPVYLPTLRALERPALQRKCTCGNSPGADSECAGCERKKLDLQRKASGRKPDTVPPIVHEVLSAPGYPLDREVRSFMEPRFGHDFSRVRIHADYRAAESARAVAAQAYTVGRDVVFGEGQYRPESSEGIRLLAHELTHVAQQRGASENQSAADLAISEPDSPEEREAQSTVSHLPREQPVRLARQPASRPVQSEFGQAAQGVTRRLISDLTSPIVVGSAVRYKVIQTGDEIRAQESVVRYHWTLRDRKTDAVVQEREEDGVREAEVTASPAGQFRIQVEILLRQGSSVSTIDTLSLDQDFVAEDPQLTESLAAEPVPEVAKAKRELINDFKKYIGDAAQATGAKGITPLFLASVLHVEIENRPKEGREEELETVNKNLIAIRKGETLLPMPWNRVDRSLGAGQIRMSTAAMALNLIPWTDQDRNDRSKGREKTGSDFEKLDIEKKLNVFELLRWPKSNINTAGTLLSRLKNRPNRYPTLDRADFAKNEKAVGVIATEYNSGPTNSPEASASSAQYGGWVWQYMQDPVLQTYFSNT